MNEGNNLSQKINDIRIKDKRRKKILISILCVILLAIIAVSALYVFILNDRYENDTKKDKLSAFADNDIKSDAAEVMAEIKEEPPSSKEKEENALKELSPRLISLISDKYPSATLSFAIKNLDTGAYFEHNNIRMNSASIIKLFILETVFDRVTSGEYTLTPEYEKELREMINDSKNTAANLFIDEFGGDNEIHKITEENLINQNIKKHGYQFTEINRKMFDTTPPWGPTGFDNYTSVGDVCTLLEGIYKGTAFAEPYNTQAIGYMKEQKRRGKLPAKISSKYPDITIANKTGELSQVENDVAIIMCEDFNLIFSVLINDIPLLANGGADYKLKMQVQESIADMGLMLADFYKANKF